MHSAYIIYLKMRNKGFYVTIIIPMAGLSTRFYKSGYKIPKYMLNIGDKSVFYYAISSFKHYFNIHKIIFIYRNINDTASFIRNECKIMNIQLYDMVELSFETLGQAHTTMLGLQEVEIESYEAILIFNIDTFRQNFILPTTLDFKMIDGYIEVFNADGEQWSFILPKSNTNKILKTSEKERISSLCSSGLYYFSYAKDFIESFNMALENKLMVKNEYYIAPLYNNLIQKGKDIRYFKINLNEIVFCGTPQDYERLKQINYKG